MELSRARVPAGVLNLVLAICIIVSAIVGALLLLVYHRNIIINRNNQLAYLERNVNSGFAYLLANKLKGAQEKTFDLFGEGGDTVLLSNQPWGLYDVAQVQAKAGNLIKYKSALVGGELDTLKGIALYLTDEDRPLFIAKGVAIEGNSYLPRAGVKNVSLEATPSGDFNSIKGKVLISNRQLPSCFQNVIERVKKNVGYLLKEEHGERPLTLQNSNEKRLIYNSFLNPSYLIQSDDLLVLDNVALTGKVIINSMVGVVIGSKAKVKDILVSAPYIIIADNFSGSLQAFAQDSIIVGKNCTMQYPSVLGLYNEKANASLVIGESSILIGEIVLSGGPASQGLHQLSIQKQASVSGLVYVNGLVEHLGKISGGLFCRRLMVRTPSSLYENYITDAILSGKDLSDFFLASAELSDKGRRETIKWLN